MKPMVCVRGGWRWVVGAGLAMLMQGAAHAQMLSIDELFRRFSVDKMPLGHVIDPGSAVYRAYRCTPSEQFSEHMFCTRQLQDGRVNSRYTILHDVRMKVNYVSRGIAPAFFRRGDIDNEIRRLSDAFKLAPSVRHAPSGSIAQGSVIATWGTLVLEPIDRELAMRLATGQQIRNGMMVDFLNNFQRSAREGLPIYGIRGGFGYIYAASLIDNEDGQLRMTAANPGAYAGMPAGGSASPPASALSFAPSPNPAAATAQAVAPDPQRLAEERARLEAEDARRREAENKRREDEARRSDEARRARLAQMMTPAQQLISDAKAMISANPGLPKLLEYVEALAELNAAMAQNDPDLLEKRVSALSTALLREPAYVELQKKRLDDKARQEALHLGQAIELVKLRRQEVMRYLAEEPASPIAASFLPLLRQIEPALNQPSLDVLQPLTEKIEFIVRQNNLQDRFAAYAAKAAPTAAGEDREVMPRTPKTAVVLDGDLNDLIVFYNASPNAPNVARNLRGELDFAKGRANACLFQANADERLIAEAKGQLRKLSATQIDLKQACKPAEIGGNDLIVGVRGDMLRVERQEALVLSNLLESDTFRLAASVSGADRRRQRDEERQLADTIEQDVLKNARRGFGLVVFETASPAVCLVTPDRQEGHKQVLTDAAERLAVAMNASPEARVVSAEEAFRLLQRKECGASYQSADDLAALVPALKREGIAYRFAPLWFSEDDIAGAQQASNARREAAAVAEADRTRRAAELVKLETLKANDAQASAAAQQAQWRNDNKDKAARAADRIADIVREWTNAKAGAAPTLFPAYANGLRERLDHRWQVQTMTHEIGDYGTVQWKDRPVTAGVANVTLRLRNSILGEYDTVCHTFAVILDDEFSVLRGPFDAPCSNGAALAAWKRDNRFSSQWTAVTANE